MTILNVIKYPVNDQIFSLRDIDKIPSNVLENVVFKIKKQLFNEAEKLLKINNFRYQY